MFFLILVLLLVSLKADLIKPLSSTPLRPYSINKDYTTDYTLSFYVPTPIPFGASLEIEFPIPYAISSTCKAFIRFQNQPFIPYSCEKIPNSKYSIRIGIISQGDYQLVLENIRNPSAYPASSNFKIRTYFNKEILVDANEYFEAIPFLPTPSISKNGSIANLGYDKVNLGSKFDFSFYLTKPIKQGDSIKFNFPEGFFFIEPACFHRNSGGYAQPETLYNNRMVICQSFPHDFPLETEHVVSIIGVVNPDHAGIYRGFSLETMEGISPNVYEKIEVPIAVEILPGNVIVKIYSESLLKSANTTHQLDMVFENDIPAGGEVWIKFPSGFRYLASTCKFLRALQPETNKQVTCELALNKTGYIIRGFSGISSSQLISVQVTSENPPAPASYVIHVFSFSLAYNAKIDQGSSNITLEDQFGSSMFFKSHSLRFTRRLRHNEVGPLEFTFFLNNPLPATVPPSEGKIVIDIRPQIPDPGEEVCYFYKTVLAQTCKWEVPDSDSSLSKVTIKTPVTDSYFHTEIPITITAKVEQGTTGVKLPELIQRYKFYIYFYKDQEKDFHEVYYEDYVPEPITMPDDWLTYTFAPKQYGEYSYLKIVLRNKYLDLKTNYFVEIEFNHGNPAQQNGAWDPSLGWGGPIEWYAKHTIPCIVENLGNNYKCTLKPPKEEQDNKENEDKKSIIRVVGLSNIDKSKGDTDASNPVFHFPYLKFGTQNQAYMRFTLYQNTPGENTLSIPIMFKDINFAPQSSETVSETNDLIVDDAKVSETRTLTLSLQPGSSRPSFIIYTFDKMFGLKNGPADCGSGRTCYVFTEPVNWIVFDSSGEADGTISIHIQVQTPPYSGKFAFTAKVIQQDQVVQVKKGEVSITPGNPVISFREGSNAETNMNSLMEFDIQFSLASPLPAIPSSDSTPVSDSIVLTFSSLTVPTGDDFFCRIVNGLASLDEKEIICERISSSQIKIHNLQAVPVNTPIHLVVRAITGNTRSATARVTVDTFYQGDTNKKIDSSSAGLPLTLDFDSFGSPSIVNDRSGQVVRVLNTGKLNLQLVPTNSQASSVSVYFPIGFAIVGNDVLMCRAKAQRKFCFYSAYKNPFTITVNGFTSGQTSDFSISTEYSDPKQKGIQAPDEPGWCPVSATIGNEKVGDFVYIYPKGEPEFSIEAVPRNAGQYAMYTFTIKLTTPLPKNAGSDTTGRMFIDFPTQFTVDLGTEKKTGEYIGCNIEGLTPRESLHCRIILSPGANLPTSVEIVGFDEVTDPATTEIVIRVGKIRNPLTVTGEYKFTLRTETFTLSAEEKKILPFEYTTYSLWHPVEDEPELTPVEAPIAEFQSTSSPGQTGQILTFRLFSQLKLSPGDYYVYQLPPEIFPSVTINPPQGFDLALSFPDAGWVVYRLGTEIPARSAPTINIDTITVPTNFPGEGYDITAFVWSGKTNKLVETLNYKTNTISGSITGTSATANPSPLLRNSVNNEILIQFTLKSSIPSTGSIEIKFPQGFTPHANCKSLDFAGSQLTPQQGRVACESRESSWILTNIGPVGPQTTVKVFGLVDLPDTAPGSSDVEINTYYNQAEDLAADGRKIDSTTIANAFTLSNQPSLELDSAFTSLVNERITAGTNKFYPFVFDFTLKGSPVARNSVLELALSSTSTAFAGGLPNSAITICYFIDLDTSQTIACSSESAASGSTTTYKLTTLEDLSPGVNYRGVLTTVFADGGNDGIKFPRNAGVYSATLKANNEADLAFFEVVPDKFKSVIVKNYMISSPDDDIIDISIDFGSTIRSDNRIVVEIPTVYNETNMFDEDLGQKLDDGQEKDCDVISSTPAGIKMSCFFQKGNRNAGTPASVVLYGFSQGLSTLRFAFTVKNPTVSPTVLPLTIYTLTAPNSFTKGFYQYVEKALVIPNSTPITSTDSTAPRYDSTATNTRLTIDLKPSQDLKPSDYYIIRTPTRSLVSGSSQTVTITDITSSNQAILLPKSGYIIINAQLQATKTYPASIPNVFAPSIQIAGRGDTFTGFVSYFSTMTREIVTYSTAAAGAAAAVGGGFRSNPKVEPSNRRVYQNSILTITIDANFQGVKSAIIELGNVVVGTDCYESPKSAIKILQCTPDTANNRVLLTFEDTLPNPPTQLVFRILVTNGGPTQLSLGSFAYHLYTNIETDPSNIANRIYFVQADTGINLLAPAAEDSKLPKFIEFGYVPVADMGNQAGNGNYYDDLSFKATIASLATEDRITVRLTGFTINFDTQRLGDVSSAPAFLISIGDTTVVAPAQYDNNAATLTFSIPASLGTALSGSPEITFRLTQIARIGDSTGVQVSRSTRYPIDVEVYGSGSNTTPRETQTLEFNHNTTAIKPSRAPIRIEFELATALAAGTGRVIVTLPKGQFGFSSQLVCTFKTYSGSNVESTDSAATCIITGGGSIITVTTSTELGASDRHELIVNTDDSNQPGFDLVKGNQQLSVSFMNQNTAVAYATLDLYEYQEKPFVVLSNPEGFYYTTSLFGDPNTLIFNLASNKLIKSFPNTLMELELSSASTDVIKKGVIGTQRDITCGIIGLNTRSGSNANPRCVLIHSSPPRIRIENYADIPNSQSFYLMLYDLDNNIISKDLSYFSSKLIITDLTDNTQSQHQLTRLFTTTSGTSTNLPDKGTLTVPSTDYGASTTLTTSLAWNNANACLSCKIIGRGQGLPWKFQEGSFSLAIANNAQDLLIDSVNSIFVIRNVDRNLDRGTSEFSFAGSNVRAPYQFEVSQPYQIQLEFTSEHQRRRVVDLQATYPTFTNPPGPNVTISCPAFGGFKVGKDGNVDCIVTIPLQPDIAAVKVDFPNSGGQQYSQLYPFCNAVLSGGATLPKNQIVCSRQDPSKNQATLFFTGFPEGNMKSLSFILRARALDKTLTASVELQVSNGGKYDPISATPNAKLEISSAFETTGTAPTKFMVSEVYQKRIDSAPKILRVAMKTANDLTVGKTITLTLGQGYSDASRAQPVCTLRNMKDFSAPFLTACSYTANSYTLTLLSAVPKGNYLVEISFLQRDSATEGLPLSSQVTLGVTLESTQDSTYVGPAPGFFEKFNIIQRNTIASSNSQFDLSFKLSNALGGDTTGETLLIIEFPNPPYDPDLGVLQADIFSTGSTSTAFNGMPVPSVLPSSFSSAATIHFGKDNDRPILIIPVSQGLANSELMLSFAYLKNPPNKGLSVKASIVRLSGQTTIQSVVLYQASYIHYFNTIEPGPTGAKPLTIMNFSPSSPSLATTLTLRKDFDADIDANSKIFVKLRNQAKGFNYNAIKTIVCNGYTVQWYKAGYIFFLVPNAGASKVRTLSTECTGFVLGSTIEDLVVEVGIHREKYNRIESSSKSQSMVASQGIEQDSLTVARIQEEFSIINPESINYYTIKYNPSAFVAEAGGYMVLEVPPELEIVQDRLKHIVVTGLKDWTSGSTPRAVSAVLQEGNKIKIDGYETFDSSQGQIQIDIFLRNKEPKGNKFAIKFYDGNDNLVSQSSAANSPPIRYPKDAPLSVKSANFGPYLTDTLDVYAGETYPLVFNLQFKTALTNSDGKLEIAVPNNFELPKDENYVCKYSLDEGVNWVRSACSMSSTNVLTIPIAQRFGNIPANVNIPFLITSDNPQISKGGIIRPSDSVLNTFNVKFKTSTAPMYSTFLPLVILPDPDLSKNANVIWHLREHERSSTQASVQAPVISASFTVAQDIDSTYYFQLELVTNDELMKIFPYVLTSVGDLENRSRENCVIRLTAGSSDQNAAADCFLIKGEKRTPSGPAKIIIRNKNQNPITAGTTVRIYIANIKNPSQQEAIAGYTFSVMKPCRDDGFGCPIIRKRDYYRVLEASSPPLVQIGTPRIDKARLYENQVTTTFELSLSPIPGPNDAIIIKTDKTNVQLTSQCISPQGFCINFPKIGWTFLQPNGGLGSSAQIQIVLDNAVFYDKEKKLRFWVENWVGGKFANNFFSNEPQYRPLPFTTVTVPTQADIKIQRIVRNFNNILQITLQKIWKNEYMKRIVVNIPETYPPIDDYCMAGTNLADISSPDYVQFECNVEGDRMINIVIDEPWNDKYKDSDVVVYFRGFLEDDPSKIGQTLPSVISTFADVEKDWVIHENKAYFFVIDKEPTPVIRNISLNLKSFNDRQARISDYVELYGAVWPYTNKTDDPAKQIKSMLFQVDNEYDYPSVSKLICDTKDIRAEQVDCELKRDKGRTEISVNMPKNYQNKPFLFRITNTQENLLFRAPDHEGSFRFNLTFLNENKEPVEKAVSYMEISGEFVSDFIAQPLLKDDLVTSLYDVRFTTAGRKVPQGYFERGQTVQTEIALLFQTEASGFPIDLGSGLDSGSEISCIPVQGITATRTGKLTCTLVQGTQIIRSVIRITGYDAIPALTDVVIFLDDIKTLEVDKSSGIKLEIRSTYSGSDQQYVFYNSLEFSPQRPTPKEENKSPLLYITGPSSTIMRGTSSYTFSFQTSEPLKANQDYIIIEFPEYGYERDSEYSGTGVEITSPNVQSKHYIMPKRNIIYIELTEDLNAGPTEISITNLPNPSFYLEGSLSFTVKTVKENKVKDVFITKAINFKSTVCNLFSNEQITSSSRFIIVNENTYEISFELDHTVPSSGSIAIVFDPTLYNLRSSSPTCELKEGFSSQATCEFELFAQQLVRVKLNGVAPSRGSLLKLNVINVNNPTDSTKSPIITIQSYFDAEIDTTKLICSKDTPISPFLPNDMIRCLIEVYPEINNAGKVTDYIITLLCSTSMRNFTTLEVQFPIGFQDSFETDLSCSIEKGYLLQPCSQVTRTLNVLMLLAKPDPQAPIITRIRGIRNPSLPGKYGPVNIKFYQYGVLYGNMDLSQSLAQIDIVPDQSITKDNVLSVSVFPRNFGEKATYFFKLFDLVFPIISPEKLIIEFDPLFTEDLGPSIDCGTFIPQEQFEESYALNYEELNGFKSFPCSVIDSRELLVELSPIIFIETNKAQEFFFFVRNIQNPNVHKPDQNTYSFTFTFTAAQTALLISKNAPTINFELPPSLIKMNKVTASDTNILAHSAYTFSLSAKSNLPSSDLPKDYEIAISFPLDRYPTFSQQNAIGFSFPSNPKLQEGSSIFNYNGIVLVDALYRDLSTFGVFDIKLENIINPSTESTCDPNSSVAPLSFGTQYLSRRYNMVYGRTYSIMDQDNCLSIGSFRTPIKVVSPLYFRQGLVYTISLQLDEPGSGLTLTPVSSSFIFEPLSVSFKDYKARVVSLKVFVPRNIPQGDYKIIWKKTEAAAKEMYLNVEDTNIIVVEENASVGLTPKPKVRIEKIRYVWRGRYPRDVIVTLDQEPTEELIIRIGLKKSDPELMGSGEGEEVFSMFPISLRFTRGESKKKFYIFAGEAAKDNVLVYTLEGTNANAYDPSILDSPFMVKTEQAQKSIEILSIKKEQVGENSAQYTVSLSDMGTLYYLVQIRSVVQPTDSQIIQGRLPSVGSDFYQAGSVLVQKAQDGQVLPISIDINGLHSQADYQLYFIARDNFGGYSDVRIEQFTTLRRTEGATIIIPIRGKMKESDLITALSSVLSISKNRFISQGVVLDQADSNPEDQLNKYKFVLVPDPYNNDPSPMSIASKLLDESVLNNFAALIPRFQPNFAIRVAPIKGNFVEMPIYPSILDISYYTIVIQANLMNPGRVYGIAVEKGKFEIPPTNLQISKGLAADNTPVGAGLFNQTLTDDEGNALLYFDELKDFMEYEIYITACNNLPYEPCDLLKDKEIRKLEGKTLKNPNLGTMDEAIGLYVEFYERGESYGDRKEGYSLFILVVLFVMLYVF